jgi:hypothetical protein
MCKKHFNLSKKSFRIASRTNNPTFMSKKNKVLKQLVKAQIQSGAQGTPAGASLSGFQHNPTTSTTSNTPVNPATVAKEGGETVLIKKDIRLSIILIIAVIILLIAIFFLDRQFGFLLQLANLLLKSLKLS